MHREARLPLSFLGRAGAGLPSLAVVKSLHELREAERRSIAAVLDARGTVTEAELLLALAVERRLTASLERIEAELAERFHRRAGA